MTGCGKSVVNLNALCKKSALYAGNQGLYAENSLCYGGFRWILCNPESGFGTKRPRVRIPPLRPNRKPCEVRENPLQHKAFSFRPRMRLLGKAVQIDRFERPERAVRGKAVVIYHIRNFAVSMLRNAVFRSLPIICVLTGFSFRVEVSLSMRRPGSRRGVKSRKTRASNQARVSVCCFSVLCRYADRVQTVPLFTAHAQDGVPDALHFGRAVIAFHVLRCPGDRVGQAVEGQILAPDQVIKDVQDAAKNIDGADSADSTTTVDSSQYIDDWG